MASYERSLEQLVGWGWAKAEIAAEKGFGNLVYLYNEAYRMHEAEEQEMGLGRWKYSIADKKIEEKADCPQYGTVIWFFLQKKDRKENSW